MEKKSYDISKPLRTLLYENGITAYQLSKALGINRAMLSQYINGTSRAGMERIQLFSNYFHVDEKYFTEYSDSNVENDTSEIEVYKKQFSEALTKREYNQNRKALINTLNYTFDNLDDSKTINSLFLDVYAAIEKANHGINYRDMQTDRTAIQKMKNILSEHLMSRTESELKDAISNTPGEGKIESNSVNEAPYKAFMNGFESGVNITISEQDKFVIDKFEELSDVSSHRTASYGRNVMFCLEDAFEHLNNNNIDGSLHNLNQLSEALSIQHNDVFEFDGMRSSILNLLKEMNSKYFDNAINIVISLAKGDSIAAQDYITQLQVNIVEEQNNAIDKLYNLTKEMALKYHYEDFEKINEEFMKLVAFIKKENKSGRSQKK